MNKLIGINEYGEARRITSDHIAWGDFLRSMAKNNTFCPSIKRILFNLKTTETKPVLGADGKPVTDEKGRVKRQTVEVTPSLATIIYFNDGTKSSVVNSGKDVVAVEEKEVTYTDCKPDGTESVVKTGHVVKVASDAAKEAGIMYALGKRMFGAIENDPKKKGYGKVVNGDGFGRKLHGLVDAAFDTQYEAAFNDEMKKLAAKEHKDREAAAKERRANRKPSFEENLAAIADFVRKQAETKMA